MRNMYEKRCIKVDRVKDIKERARWKGKIDRMTEGGKNEGRKEEDTDRWAEEDQKSNKTKQEILRNRWRERALGAENWESQHIFEVKPLKDS